VGAHGPLPDFEKRFRAVLAADVVSYTRLMEAAELETHARYRTLRVGVIDPTIVSYRGDLVKNTGDGFLAVFESPHDAVRCASELQEEITNQEIHQPPERRIAFRMGLHWDPVLFDLNDVYGHGVNTAVRLQSIAPAGGIVVSSALLSSAGDDVRRLRPNDLGPVHLKNFSRPVHAFSLNLPGLDPANPPLPPRDPSQRRAKPPSVAILPLLNHSDPEDSYLGEGFIEDIIVSLSNIPELLVVARGSTLAFRQQEIDALQIGQRLGVQYLLGGSIRRSRERIRLSVELIEVKAGLVIWAEKYDFGFQEVFDVQDEIAITIVNTIATHVRRVQIKRALRKKPRNLNAYDHLLQGLDLLYRLDFPSFSRARTLLEQARQEDDSYAPPFAFSAHWHMINIAEGWSTDAAADADEVLRLTTAATERDPANALALALQGHARAMFFREYDAALELVDRAVAVSPSSSWAWVFSSGPYGFVGKTEAAIDRAQRAIRLSPLDQYSFFNLCLLGQNHYLHGTFEEAIRWSRKSLDLNPRFGNAARVLAASLVAVGEDAEAHRIAEYHKNILPRFTVSEYAHRCPFKEPQASAYVERLAEAGLPP
jgi:adenylate cyclase